MGTKRTVLGVLVSAALLVLAGCGSSEKSDEGGSGDGGKYGLPQGIASVTIGTAVGTAPYEFYEGSSKEIKGYEPDLLNEVASRLGVKIEWKTTDFPALFTGLDSGRFDLAANGIIDRKSRQERYDVLDYIKDASSVAGLAGSTSSIKDTQDLCGKTLATQSGTSFEVFFNEESKKCKAEQKPEIKVLLFKDPAGATLAVKSGRADFVSNQIALLAYSATQEKDLEVGSATYLEGLAGLVFPKGSPLIEPFSNAIDELISDGTYAEILAKWDLSNLAIDETALNAGTLE